MQIIKIAEIKIIEGVWAEELHLKKVVWELIKLINSS